MSIRPKELTKGYIVNEDTGDTLLFQFNPEEFITTHGANYIQIESPGAKYPKFSYVGRQAETIPLKLQFYGYKNIVSGMSSTEIENYIVILTKPKQKQKNIIKGSNHFISPPICTFVFGLRTYECIVNEAKITRKLFNNKLRTMMLDVDLSMTVLKR